MTPAPDTRRRRLVRGAVRLAMIAGLAAGLAGLVVVAAPAGAATDENGDAAASLLAPLGEELRGNDYGLDWRHCVQVVANLRAEPPEVPVVVLLGGSSARECTVSDADWARQIDARGGPAVLACNLGSKHRTYAQDLEFVKLLPRVPTIVYIGINLGRFCAGPRTPVITLPDPAPLSPYGQHVYSKSRIQRPGLKRYYVAYWMKRRYPEFRTHFTYQLGLLEKIIRTCRRRGLRVALVDLPRDLPAIGRSFDVPVGRFHRGCARLARRYHIPWFTFVKTARLRDSDFFDIFHLVEPGRTKYQRILSDKTIRLLDKYGMTPSPSPSPSPSSSASPSTSPPPASSL